MDFGNGDRLGSRCNSIRFCSTGRVSSQVLVGILLLSLGLIVGGTFGGLIAAFLGFTQGLLLRQHGYSILTFALASFGGGFIGSGLSAVGVFVALVAVLLRLIPPSIELFVILLLGSSILTGFVIGYVQGNLLESKRLTKSKWARINATAWAGGCAISAILGQVFFDYSNWLIFLPVLPNTSAIILATVCGLVIGTITGYPLMRALQQSSIQNPKSEI